MCVCAICVHKFLLFQTDYIIMAYGGFCYVRSFHFCFRGECASLLFSILLRLCNVTHVGNKFAFSSVKHAIKKVGGAIVYKHARILSIYTVGARNIGLIN